MQVIHSETSTNGRWGVQIVGEPVQQWPVQGKLHDLGNVEGMRTFRLEVCNSGQWILPCGDVEVVAGAVVVYRESMQSSNEATIIVGGSFFAVKRYGYKRRSNHVVAYKDGVEVDLPAGVLVAMGILPASKNEPVEVELPELDSPIAAALKAAGIV